MSKLASDKPAASGPRGDTTLNLRLRYRSSQDGSRVGQLTHWSCVRAVTVGTRSTSPAHNAQLKIGGSLVAFNDARSNFDFNWCTIHCVTPCGSRRTSTLSSLSILPVAGFQSLASGHGALGASLSLQGPSIQVPSGGGCYTGKAAEPPSRRAAEPPSRRAAEPPSQSCI